MNYWIINFKIRTHCYSSHPLTASLVNYRDECQLIWAHWKNEHRICYNSTYYLWSKISHVTMMRNRGILHCQVRSEFLFLVFHGISNPMLLVPYAYCAVFSKLTIVGLSLTVWLSFYISAFFQLFSVDLETDTSFWCS